jgi:Ca2+-binding EF-hand superfamily protein
MLSSVQQSKVAHLFNVLDSNKNGELQLEDFVEVCEEIIRNLGWNGDEREAKLMLRKTTRLFIQLLMDVNKQEMTITFHDWLKFFEKELEKKEGSGLLYYYIYRINHHLFNLFDLNNDGYIDFSEYVNMFGVYNISMNECQESFNKLDHNHDDRISREELIHGLDEFFKSSREDARGNWVFGNWK